MPSTTTLAVFSGAALVLLVIPGPAVLYVLARSAAQGRRAGLVSVAGLHTGTAVHVAAAVVGLSGVLVASAAAFTTVKLAGAVYLLYLGVRALLDYRRQRQAITPPSPSMRTLRRIYVDGVVVNVLNPKTAVFFLAFVPQFVDRTAGDAPVQLVVLGLVFIALGLLSDGAYALIGAADGDRLHRLPRVARRSHLFTGAAYLGLGVTTATAGAADPV